jgi:hypothetical protein
VAREQEVQAPARLHGLWGGRRQRGRTPATVWTSKERERGGAQGGRELV